MKVWIFQARPDQYDLLKQIPLRIEEGDWWTVPRFRHEMRKRDVILFWIAGKDAGIYGTGRISGTKAEKIGGKWRFDVEYNGLLRIPILKKELLKDRTLKNLSVIKQPRGGNFRVTSEQWKLLKRFRRLQHVDAEDSSAIPTDIQEEIAASGRFDPKSTKDARKRMLSSIVVRQGQPEFRRQLLGLYGGKCMATGCNAEEALEAAHLIPYRGKHTNHPENGLLLRSDLHALFDLHLLAVDTRSMTLILAPSLKKTTYRELHGKRLAIPKDCPFPPSKQALLKHRKKCQKSW